MGASFRRFAGLLATAAILPGSAISAWANEDLEIATPAVTSREYTSAGRLRGAELGKLVEQSLGAGNYQQVTIVLGTCHSGAGLAPTAAALSGPHNVIASCGARQTTANTYDPATKSVTGVVPGLFDAIRAAPEVTVDAALKAGAATSKRVPQGRTAAELAQWEAIERGRYEANRAARQRSAKAARDEAVAANAPAEVIQRRQRVLDDASRRPDWDKGGRDLWVQDPATAQSGDRPGTKKLGTGTKSNHAIVYQAYADEGSVAETRNAVDGLKAAGYQVDVLTPLSRADYDALDRQIENGQPLSVDPGRATPDNLKKRLETLRGVMTKDEALAIVVISHGALTLQSDRTQSAVGVGNGAVIRAASAHDRIDDTLLTSMLIEEARSPVLGGSLADYGYFTRWGSPSLLIQTASETATSGEPVLVLANGLPLGTLMLDRPTGGLHRLPFSDEFIDSLMGGPGLDGGMEIEFRFGDPLDSFSLATFEDMAANPYSLGHFGLSLALHLDGGIDVPEPPAMPLALAALAMGLATRIRRLERRRPLVESSRHPSAP